MPVRNFKGADFKSDNFFRKFWAQTTKFEHFGPKSVNFLILTKFCLYAIPKVLVSNLPFAFCGSYQPSTLVRRTNSMFPLCNLYGKYFFLFLQKSQNIVTSVVFFFKLLIANIALTHIMPLVSSYTSWKHQKTRDLKWVEKN